MAILWCNIELALVRSWLAGQLMKGAAFPVCVGDIVVAVGCALPSAGSFFKRWAVSRGILFCAIIVATIGAVVLNLLASSLIQACLIALSPTCAELQAFAPVS